MLLCRVPLRRRAAASLFRRFRCLVHFLADFRLRTAIYRSLVRAIPNLALQRNRLRWQEVIEFGRLEPLRIGFRKGASIKAQVAGKEFRGEAFGFSEFDDFLPSKGSSAVEPGLTGAGCLYV